MVRPGFSVRASPGNSPDAKFPGKAIIVASYPCRDAAARRSFKPAEAFMSLIQFTRNFDDESTDRGFQFVFMCDRCGNGFRTRFQPSATGAVSGALDAAGSLLGGLLYRAADAGRAVHSAAWEKAHDAAFERAVQEATPHFHKCKRCGHWVDDDCWNQPRNLCKDCAPDL